jgi:hypothetical protein
VDASKYIALLSFYFYCSKLFKYIYYFSEILPVNENQLAFGHFIDDMAHQRDVALAPNIPDTVMPFCCYGNISFLISGFCSYCN